LLGSIGVELRSCGRPQDGGRGYAKCGQGEGGCKNYIFADVLYGWPLTRRINDIVTSVKVVYCAQPLKHLLDNGRLTPDNVDFRPYTDGDQLYIALVPVDNRLRTYQ